MIIHWARRKRLGDRYWSGSTIRKYTGDRATYSVSIGWAIRTRSGQTSPFWLVPTGEGIRTEYVGTTGLEIGPFDSFEAAKAAAVVMCTPKK